MDSIRERVGKNAKCLLQLGLLIATFLFIAMAFLAYYSTDRPSVVGSVVATAFFASILNLLTVIGNNNYFMVYLYFVLTVLHTLINIAISVKFPVLNVVVLLQIILMVIAFVHARNLRVNTSKRKFAELQLPSEPRYNNEYSFDA